MKKVKQKMKSKVLMGMNLDQRDKMKKRIVRSRRKIMVMMTTLLITKMLHRSCLNNKKIQLTMMLLRMGRRKMKKNLKEKVRKVNKMKVLSKMNRI